MQKKSFLLFITILSIFWTDFVYANNQCVNLFTASNISLPSDLIKKWYGSSFLRTWSAKSKINNLNVLPLLTEPGIADRAAEFILFSTDYIKQNPSTNLTELRFAFSNYLGSRKVYRALVLTEQQATYIKTHGMLSPGLYSGKNSLSDWFNSKNSGPVHDITSRNLIDDNQLSLVLSVSSIPEVAIAGSSSRFNPNDLSKSIYLFELNIPEIEIVNDNQRLSTTPAYRKLRLAKKDTAVIIQKSNDAAYNSNWDYGYTEAYVFNKIHVSQITTVTKITDRSKWQVTIGPWTKGTISLDPDQRMPLRKFQVPEDPSRSFLYE